MSIISSNPSFKERKDHIEIATTATAYGDILTNAPWPGHVPDWIVSWYPG